MQMRQRRICILLFFRPYTAVIPNGVKRSEGSHGVERRELKVERRELSDERKIRKFGVKLLESSEWTL